MAKAIDKQIVSLKDERLDIDRIDHSRLSFFIGEHAIQFGVKDTQTNRLMLFEEYEIDPSKDLISFLDQLHKEHILIAAGFWQEIQVFFRNNKFALIPGPLFDKTKLYEYVRLNDNTEPSRDNYHFKQLDTYGLSFAFAYQDKIKSWFKENYPKVNLRFSHQGVAFLHHVKEQLKPNAQASVYLDLKGQQALIAGMNFEKLALYNQFVFKNADHLAKITALSCQQFSSDRSQTPLIITGEKETVDNYLPVLKKYFKMIEMAKRPINLKVHPVFNELEPYEYSEILSNL